MMLAITIEGHLKRAFPSGNLVQIPQTTVHPIPVLQIGQQFNTMTVTKILEILTMTVMGQQATEPTVGSSAEDAFLLILMTSP